MERLKKVKYTFHKFCDSIKNIKAEYSFYKRLWDKPQAKAAFANAKTQLIYLLKKIRPRKLEGNVIVGTGDPASTGEMIGAVAMFYGCYPETFRIVPDFEEQRLEGTVRIRGKIRLIHIVLIAIKLIADKNIRYIIKKIQSKEDVTHERK